MKKILRILFYFFIVLAAWIPLAWCVANFLMVEKPLEKADVILVLGGSATFEERTDRAAELFKQGVAPKILLTNDGEKGGWNKQLQRNPYFFERAKWQLIANGVPENAIEILPEEVTGTIYEAKLLKKFAAENNLNSLLIVTSAYHSRRAQWTFERTFGAESRTVIGIETPKTGIETPSRSLWWVSEQGWRFVAGEYIKTVYYWIYY